MRILALLMYATAVVCTTLAFSGSFETARTEEINGVIRVSDGLVMIGLSKKYDEPYIETLVLKIDFSGEVLWVKEYGTPGDDIGRCLTVTGDGLSRFKLILKLPSRTFLVMFKERIARLSGISTRKLTIPST